MNEREKNIARCRAYYRKNREALLAKKRESYRTNPDKITARNKQWRKANRDALLARLREAYAKNQEKYLERKRRWYYETPSGKRKSFRLPPEASDALLKFAELLRKLKQEKKRGHK